MLNSITQTTQTSSLSTPLKFRPGTVADSYDVYQIGRNALVDLTQRTGVSEPEDSPNPEDVTQEWLEHHSLFEHLARTAEHFWVAERGDRPIGYARTINHDGVRELTELFILPEAQSAGVGRELLARAFPPNGAKRRCIIATLDARAQARYLKTGVYPRFPIYTFSRKPEQVAVPSNLTVQPVQPTPQTLTIMAEIDRQIINHRRDANHNWFFANRQGYLYYRNRQPVGYGYVGRWNGPFALLDERDYPAVLAHAESESAAQNRDKFAVDVPMVNHVAVDYLLGRDYQMSEFIVYWMSDEPFGKFENYIITAPMFFI